MISVIVPVYNMRRYLPRCIESIRAQTCPDFEVLLVDDGSTDGSGKICEDYARTDRRISVVHKTNGGLSSARNCGIEHAKGAFIVFPDPDDWAEPGYLEGLLSIREKTGADLSICGHYYYDYNREKVWNPSGSEVILGTEEALDYLMHPYRYCGYAWNKLYDMERIQEHGLRFDEELGSIQDLHFAFRYFLLCKKIAYDPVPLYHYRAGGGTDRASPLTERKLSGLQAYYKIAQLARESPYPKFESVAYRSLYDISLGRIYSYYQGKTKDPVVLNMLTDTLRFCKPYYFPNDVESVRHRIVAGLPLIHPRLYYCVLHAKRRMLGQDRHTRDRGE